MNKIKKKFIELSNGNDNKTEKAFSLHGCGELLYITMFLKNASDLNDKFDTVDRVDKVDNVDTADKVDKVDTVDTVDIAHNIIFIELRYFKAIYLCMTNLEKFRTNMTATNMTILRMSPPI